MGSVIAVVSAVTAVATLIFRWRADTRALENQTRALQQRTEADNRAEWWRRAQWAIDRANQFDDEAACEAGLMVLRDLLDSDLAREAETELLREVGLNIEARLISGREVE